MSRWTSVFRHASALVCALALGLFPAAGTTHAADTPNTWDCTVVVNSAAPAGCTAADLPGQPHPQAEQVVATGPDGRIYATGGCCDSGALQPNHILEAYDTATKQWSCSTDDTPSVDPNHPTECASTTLTPIPTGRVAPASITAPNATGTKQLLYVIGGLFGQSALTGGALGLIETYDPSTNSWACSTDNSMGVTTLAYCSTRTLTPMPTPREAMVVSVLNGLIYVAGGTVGSGAMDIVEAYNPATNLWICSQNDPAPLNPQQCSAKTLADMPAAEDDGGGVAFQGQFYTIGGEGSAVVQVYNPTTNSWSCSQGTPDPNSRCASSTLSPMPTAREDLGVAVGSDQRIYAIGGASGSYLNTVEALDPASNTWKCSVGDANCADPAARVISAMPTPRAVGQGAATAPSPDNRIYVVGGGAPDVHNTNEALTPLPPVVPTAAQVVRFGAHRAGKSEIFTWRLATPSGVVGFDLFAASRRLNRALIPVHSGQRYRYVAHGPLHGPFLLRLSMTTGKPRTIWSR